MSDYPLSDSQSRTVAEDVLMSRIAAGDRTALETLHRNYFCRIADLLGRSFGVREVETIIDDAFVIIWHNARNLCRVSPVSRYILSIAFRTAVGYFVRRNYAAGARAESFLRSANPSIVYLADRNGLEGAVRRSTIEQQLTLRLAYRLGCPLDEIATITDTTISTVRARMFQVREFLHSVYKLNPRSNRRDAVGSYAQRCRMLPPSDMQPATFELDE